MLCRSISYPPPPDSDAYRVSVPAVPGRRTALPRPDKTHRRSSTPPMTPLIRGSNLRLPEPAGRCSPDTRAFAQPSTPRASGPVADGTPALPNPYLQLYGLTQHLRLAAAGPQRAHRPHFCLRLSIGETGPCSDPTDSDRMPDAPVRLGLRRTPLRFHSIALRGLPARRFTTAGAGSSRKARLEPYCRGAGKTCPCPKPHMTTMSKEHEGESFPHAKSLERCR